MIELSSQLDVLREAGLIRTREQSCLRQLDWQYLATGAM